MFTHNISQIPLTDQDISKTSERIVMKFETKLLLGFQVLTENEFKKSAAERGLKFKTINFPGNYKLS